MTAPTSAPGQDLLAPTSTRTSSQTSALTWPRRWRHIAVGAVVLAAFAVPSDGCGPFFAQAVFVQTTRPDGDYARYAAGRIGVPQPGYRLRHLVVAYDWMQGRGLSTAEQAEAVTLDKELYNSQDLAAPDTTAPGMAGWIAARGASGVGRDQPTKPSAPGAAPATNATIDTDRSLPGESYQTFTNCLDGAFRTSADTLAARKSAHGSGPDAAAFADWVRGQDAVFRNCNGDADGLPAAAPAGAPQWLVQDRTYQTAAAKFYAEDYDGAIAILKTIAANGASPWHNTARFVIARATIRRATIGQITELPAALRVGRDAPYSADREKLLETYEAGLVKQETVRLGDARIQLARILADPAMAPFHASAQGLVDFIAVRTDPDTQAHILEQRLTAKGKPPLPGQFRQGLIDLTYLAGKRAADNSGPNPQPAPAAGTKGTDLLAWLATMRRLAPPDSREVSAVSLADIANARTEHAAASADALGGWKSGGGTPWLLAAMQATGPGGADAAPLVKAAADVTAGTPARLPVTYERLRLDANAEAARSEVAQLLPTLQTTDSRSTINLFVGLRQRSAPSLSAFLADAGTIPAGFLVDEEEPDAPGTEPNANGLCGVVSPDAQTRLFDHTAATVLNARLPLTLLAEASGSSALPANLRFEVAAATWARAVLLDRPEIARGVSPGLGSCYPAWKPVLDRYNGAATPDDRRAEGLLALMRFASTEPVVRDGEARPEGFATYSEYRDNWWGESQAAGPARDSDGKPISGSVNLPTLFGRVLTSRSELPDPPFITATDRTAADREVAELAKIPCASDYFATAALAWQKAHPADKRTPDILGYAERVVRNGCRTDATKELNHQLFNIVQSTYPKSEWAKKYSTWE